MRHFDAWFDSASEAVRQGRIGTPVCVRIVDLTAADHGRIEANLARGLAAAWGWLGSKPELVRTAGGADEGHLSALVRFASGGTAVLAAGVRGVSTPRFEAHVVGNKGGFTWEPPDPDEPADDGPTVPVDRLREAARAIREAAGRAERPVEGAPARDVPPTSVRPTKPPYGVLLVAGGATHQEDYARALAADPRCRLVGLADEADVDPRRREWNARLADELKIPVLPDLDAALKRDDVHIVSICAEPERRARIILKCAAAGKHLYLDKPLAASAEEGREIAAAVARAGVSGHMFSMVHAGVAPRAIRLARSGRLGDLRAVHVDHHFAKGPAGTAELGRPRTETRRPSVFERADSKREMYNVGVYPIVFLGRLIGRPARRVTATTGNYFFREHQRNDMEDFGAMLLEFDGGTTATVTAGRTGWRSHPLGGLHRAVLVGARGVATVDAYRPRVEVWTDEPPWLAAPPDPLDPMGFWRSTPIRMGLPVKRGWLAPGNDPPGPADVKHFLDGLEQGRPSEVDAKAAADALEVLAAAYESAATGRPVVVG